MEFLGNQLWAMTFKRVLSTLRSWVIFALHIFLPIIFLIVSIFVNRQLYSLGDLPSMHLSLNTFTDAVTLVEGADTNTDYRSILSNLLGDSYNETDSIDEVALYLVGDDIFSGDVVCVKRNFRLLRHRQYLGDAT